MAIAVPCRSWVESLRRYGASRIPAGRFVPVALLLWTASLAGSHPDNAADLVVTGVAAYTLVVQFRLWDDLSDDPLDRVHHPHRVLSQVPSLAPFRALCLVLFTFNGALLTVVGVKDGARSLLLVFLLLNGLFWSWYRWRDQVPWSGLIASHVLLGKYPVFVFLLSGPPDRATAVPPLPAMALVYGCFCVYELLHDARLRMAPGAKPLLVFHMLWLCALVATMAICLLPRNTTAALLEWALVPATAVLLMSLYRQYCRASGTEQGARAVFLLGWFCNILWAWGVRS